MLREDVLAKCVNLHLKRDVKTRRFKPQIEAADPREQRANGHRCPLSTAA